MNAQQAHREDVAYRDVVDHFLTNVVDQARYLENLFRGYSNPNPPMAYYLTRTFTVLYLIELQELLEMNDDEVIEWVSNLPEIAQLMQEHGLMFAKLDDDWSAFGRPPFLGFVMA